MKYIEFLKYEKEICLQRLRGIETELSDSKSMTMYLHRAVMILNANNHRNHSDWSISTLDNHNSPIGTVWFKVNVEFSDIYMTEFETIAIAEKYERENR